MNTKKIVRISLLAVISFLIMFVLEFPVPFFPPFLKYEPSEVPALIAAFAWGPLAGVIVELLKSVLFFISGRSTDGIIGVTAAFIAGGSFAFTAGLVYKRIKSKAGAIVGLISGSIVMTFLMAIANYYLLLPLYGIEAESILGLITSVIIPFNLFKGIVTSIITFIIYKKVHLWLDK